MDDERLDLIVSSARKWLGTTWMHNQQVIGVNGGVDCVRFLEAVAIDIGLELPLFEPHYSKIDYDGNIQNYLDDNFFRCNSISKGRILLISFRGVSSHVAIATSQTTLIHASVLYGKVVEQNIGEYYKNITNIYKVYND